MATKTATKSKKYDKEKAKREREEKIQKANKEIEEGVAALRDSEEYKKYLKFMSRFHHYSVNNLMLIARQKPDATFVAGFSTWKKMGRYPRKGERGILIFRPISHSKTVKYITVDADGNEILDENGEPVKGEKTVNWKNYTTAKVFDISQTEGEPLPTVPGIKELDGSVDGFLKLISALQKTAEDGGTKVLFKSADEYDFGEAYGLYDRRIGEILVRKNLGEVHTVKTLIHEIAHSRLHKNMDDKKSREEREVEAESVAYVVCQHFGIDTSDYSFGYVNAWFNGKEIDDIKKILGGIRDATLKIIEDVEKNLSEE